MIKNQEITPVNYLALVAEFFYLAGAFSRSSQWLLIFLMAANIFGGTHGYLTGNLQTAIDHGSSFFYNLLYIKINLNGRTLKELLPKIIGDYIDTLILPGKILIMLIYFSDLRDILIIISTIFVFLIPRQTLIYKEKFLCGSASLFWGIYYFLGYFNLEFAIQVIVASTYYISAWLSFKKQKEARK